jgi:hypothetical protein
MPITDRIVPLLARLQGGDCRAIWLAGSHATGDPGPFSDVDLGVISASGRRGFQLEVHDGVLVAISTLSEQAAASSLNEPALAGAAVPGWREATLVFDPEGCAAALQRIAREWRWEGIADACDGWCAAQAVIAADDVLKLANALERRDPVEAVARRNALAARLPLVMSVQCRLFYGSERNLFAVANGALGEEWARRHAVALGAAPAPPAEGFAAVHWLYRHAAASIAPLLDDRQRAVVDLALASIPPDRT